MATDLYRRVLALLIKHGGSIFQKPLTLRSVACVT
jgi:hypothetical protein